jgi:hypothetical protein
MAQKTLVLFIPNSRGYMNIEKLEYIDLDKVVDIELSENENNLYAELGKCISRLEKIPFVIYDFLVNSMVEYNNKEYVRFELKKNSNISNILRVFKECMNSIFRNNEHEKTILDIWKSCIDEEIKFRNKLVHGMWFSGILSMSEKWDMARIVDKRNKEIFVIDNDILRKHLENINILYKAVICIIKCKMVYRKNYDIYFKILDKENMEYDDDYYDRDNS